MFTFLQIREKNSRGWDFLAVESHQKDLVVEQNVKRLKKRILSLKNEFLLLLSKEVRDYSSFIQASMSLSDGIK